MDVLWEKVEVCVVVNICIMRRFCLFFLIMGLGDFFYFCKFVVSGGEYKVF